MRGAGEEGRGGGARKNEKIEGRGMEFTLISSGFETPKGMLAAIATQETTMGKRRGERSSCGGTQCCMYVREKKHSNSSPNPLTLTLLANNLHPNE
jgi:hypothetical protein